MNPIQPARDARRASEPVSRARTGTAPRRLTLLCLVLALSGCATEAYRATESQCAPAAYAQYPVINQTRMEMRTRPIQVPTGQTRCSSVTNGNRTDTVCQDITRTEYQSYPVYVTADINEYGRNQVIAACARNQCLRTHGNPDCK
ncbi:MAG TPA: hypothetical protein VE092_02385 [Herbaspirillum sp.]|uniref:hypothetical protein n=1 Tax=Herbaspirillum sp. TaxID=1890675 RepID=UPI002D635F51|nr:hypothetical protein [Herbaspirillum sp.]HZG18837.1 hypothetical protein [Herbaspirillum sp.]